MQSVTRYLQTKISDVSQGGISRRGVRQIFRGRDEDISHIDQLFQLISVRHRDSGPESTHIVMPHIA